MTIVNFMNIYLSEQNKIYNNNNKKEIFNKINYEELFYRTQKITFCYNL